MRCAQWVHEDDVGEQAIAEFEENTSGCVSKMPFVLSISCPVDHQYIELLLDDWIDDIGRKGAALLARQREQFAARPFFRMSPCPPWLYTGIHRRVFGIAARLSAGARAWLLCLSVTKGCPVFTQPCVLSTA